MASAPDESIRARAQQSPLVSQRPHTVNEPANEPPKPGFFPLGYKEGFRQWWTSVTPAEAEAAVLSFLPFHHPQPAVSTSQPQAETTTSPPQDDPYGPRECTSTLVPLSGKNRALNEFAVTRTAELDPSNHLVILHGYGAGLAFFYKNFDALSRRPGWKLWALDLLGYGRSTRPPFTIKSKDADGKITEAEDWFIDALEEWRKIRGIDKFTLLGHSMGGYLSVRYTLKYPERVNKLILASPVGVPEDPYAVKQELPDEGGQDTVGGDFAEGEMEASRNNPNLPNSLNMPAEAVPTASSAPVSAEKSVPSAPATKPTGKPEAKSPAPTDRPRRIPKWVHYLWEANVSPFSFVRWSGPLGPRLVSGWTSRRFGSLPQEQSQALHEYSYSLFRQKGSGEYALAYILAPGAYARRPLIWRVQDLVKITKFGIPSVWMYGEVDWMDIAGGYAAEEKIRSEPLTDTSFYTGGSAWRGEKEGPGGEAKVLVVQRAGHHIYLDNAEQFNRMITEEMDDVENRQMKQQSEN